LGRQPLQLEQLPERVRTRLRLIGPRHALRVPRTSRQRLDALASSVQLGHFFAREHRDPSRDWYEATPFVQFASGRAGLRLPQDFPQTGGWMKRPLLVIAVIAAAAVFAGTASATDVPRYQFQNATLTANVRNGDYVHVYSITMSPCNGSFTGTGGIA